MKPYLITFVIVIASFSAMLGYQYHRKAALDNYNQKMMDYTKLAFSGSAARKTAFTAEVFEKMQQNPRDLRWKRLYGTIQIDFFKNYPQAITIMEEIYQQTHDNHMLIGIGILKEKIKSPFQECNENVLKNVEQPHYYNDLNYWAAIGGLGTPYNEQDIEKSRLSEETIRYFLKQDRQMFLDNIF